MKKCKLGKYGCYEDGNCYFVKVCVNQVKDEAIVDRDIDNEFSEEATNYDYLQLQI